MNAPALVRGYAEVQPERLARWYRGRMRPGVTTPLDLLIIQGTRFCNLDCDYCYLPFRASKHRFDLGLLDVLLPKLLDAGLIPPVLALAWHAGEPTVLPIAYYREAFARVATLLGPDIVVRHNFQTNATLLTDEYCAFLKEHDVQIGVSIDGPADLHDARRKMRNGGGSHAATMRGIEALNRHGIPHSAICVLTRPALDRPDDIYEFFRDIGCKQVGFNVEEVEGYNKTTSLGEDAPAMYRRFLKQLLMRVRGERNLMEIREIAMTQAFVMGGLAGYPTTSSEAVPYGNIVLDADGNVYTFSPEMVDITWPDGESLSIGHIDDIDFTRLEENPRFRALAEPIEQGLELCRQTCRYWDSCGGAAPINRLSENGTFVSTETMHCRLTRQAIIDVVEEDMIDRIEARRAARQQPRIAARPAAPVPTPGGRTLTQDPFTLGLPILGARGLGRKIDVSSGTMPALPVPRRVYEGGAMGPRPDWRPATLRELQLLDATPPAERPFDYLAVVRLGPESLSALAPLRAAIEAGPIDRGDKLDPALVEMIAAEFGGEGKPVSLGYHRRAGGMTTTTDAPGTGELIGLHVDSWSARLAQDRDESGNRICVNLGSEPRSLIVVNAPLKRVVATMVALTGETVRTLNPTAIGRQFMLRFPDFPVLRLRVEPGEGYIAPTETIIHDGDTTAAKADFFMTILGRFPAAVAAGKIATSQVRT